MTSPARVYTRNKDLPEQLSSLKPGDIIACRLRLKPQEEHLLLDLVERGIQLIPSARAQLASRSKTFQTRLFAPFMIPHSTVIYDIHGLLDSVSHYGRHAIGKVVLKHDRKNAGLGIHLFGNIEDVYTQAANNVIPYPFVLQPFMPKSRDIRVIIIGDYREAYQRTNPDNFRNNLHCGASAKQWQLSPSQLELCHSVMARGDFPYGHLDLMVNEHEITYLAEINLRGGIRGAAIDPNSYQRHLALLESELLQQKRES